MGRRVKAAVVVVGSLAIGAIFGPVLLAASAAALWSATDETGHSFEASKLIDAYQAKLRPGRLFLSIIPPEDGAECGYSPDDIFPRGWDEMVEGRLARSYSDYEGYFALERWRNRNRDEDWISAIASEIDKQMTPFEAGFLRRCIESTVFAEMCMRRVERYGDLVSRFDGDWVPVSLAGGHEDQVVCTFVDGIAARKGIALSDRSSAPN